MPIRINLLAESQALEELRRRDPVKRTLWVGGVLVGVVLVWSATLQAKAFMGKHDLAHLEQQIAAHASEYKVVQDKEQKLHQVTERLHKLHELATDRFLNGTVLNALQQATVDDVSLVRFRVDQSYSFVEAVKPKTNADLRITAAKPATVTEKIVLTLDARDTGANPGDAIDKYKKAVEQCDYFHTSLGKTNGVRLVNFSPPQSGPDGKPFVLFTLECRYPEKTR